MPEIIPSVVKAADNLKSSRWALGRWHATRRADLGLSQRGFAKMVGFHYSLIQNIERGERSISKKHIALFAEVLKVKPTELEEMAAVTRKGFSFAEGVDPDLVGTFFWYIAHRPLDNKVMLKILDAIGVEI